MVHLTACLTSEANETNVVSGSSVSTTLPRSSLWLRAAATTSCYARMWVRIGSRSHWNCLPASGQIGTVLHFQTFKGCGHFSDFWRRLRLFLTAYLKFCFYQLCWEVQSVLIASCGNSCMVCWLDSNVGKIWPDGCILPWINVKLSL